MKLISLLMYWITRSIIKCKMILQRPLFSSYGKKFLFDPNGLYSYTNILVGHNVNLGIAPVMVAGRSRIVIGNNVMFGPEVVVVGGGHNTHAVGIPMIDVTEKRGDEDLGVQIQDDVWIGARAIILRGVVVGRGAVVGAGSIVSKSVPPYAIVVGNPARVVGFRFDVDEIILHEAALYPETDRLDPAVLEQAQRAREMLPPIRKMV